MGHGLWNTFNKPFVDHFFSFDKAAKAFVRFCRTFLNDESEASLCFIALYEDVVTESVDPFEYILQDLKQNDRYIGELEPKRCQKFQQSAKFKKAMFATEKAVLLLMKGLSGSKHWYLNLP